MEYWNASSKSPCPRSAELTAEALYKGGQGDFSLLHSLLLGAYFSGLDLVEGVRENRDSAKT